MFNYCVFCVLCDLNQQYGRKANIFCCLCFDSDSNSWKALCGDVAHAKLYTVYGKCLYDNSYKYGGGTSLEDNIR
jgi:hypothetical protein